MSTSLPWGVPPGYYCHPCANKLGLTAGVYIGELPITQYQVSKILKHTTAPTVSTKYVTVFNSTDLRPYINHVASTEAAGVVQIDKRHRRNIIWVFGRETGYAVRDLKIIHPVGGMTLVRSSDPACQHIFPSDTAGLEVVICAECGGPAITSATHLASTAYVV